MIIFSAILIFSRAKNSVLHLVSLGWILLLSSVILAAVADLGPLFQRFELFEDAEGERHFTAICFSTIDTKVRRWHAQWWSSGSWYSNKHQQTQPPLCFLPLLLRHHHHLRHSLLFDLPHQVQVLHYCFLQADHRLQSFNKTGAVVQMIFSQMLCCMWISFRGPARTEI